MSDIKGDLNVSRKIDAERRVDEGLKDWGILSGNISVDVNAHAWHTANPNLSDKNFTLPDATTLKLGWEIVVENIGTDKNILLKNYIGATLSTIEKSSAVKATLRDNSTSNGVWYIEDMNPNLTKAGIIISSGFTGNPKQATITFSNPYVDSQYAITISGADVRTWTYESKYSTGFIINTNANKALTGEVSWECVYKGDN
jgi:hypothetical protein